MFAFITKIGLYILFPFVIGIMWIELFVYVSSLNMADYILDFWRLHKFTFGVIITWLLLLGIGLGGPYLIINNIKGIPKYQTTEVTSYIKYTTYFPKYNKEYPEFVAQYIKKNLYPGIETSCPVQLSRQGAFVIKVNMNEFLCVHNEHSLLKFFFYEITFFFVNIFLFIGVGMFTKRKIYYEIKKTEKNEIEKIKQEMIERILMPEREETKKRNIKVTPPSTVKVKEKKEDTSNNNNKKKN